MNNSFNTLSNHKNDSGLGCTLKSNDSSITMVGSTQCSGFNINSPKVFQRKTSFKLFQRKSKNQSQKQPKICYISPQKSDIFKKYAINKQSLSNISSSFYTNFSNELSCFQQDKSLSTKKNLQININDSRTILNQLNNTILDKDFKTPKNNKVDLNNNQYKSPQFKKLSISKLKVQNNQKPHKTTQFDHDFANLMQINDLNLISPISSRSYISHTSSNINYFRTQNRKNKQNRNQEKQNIQQKQKINYCNVNNNGANTNRRKYQSNHYQPLTNRTQNNFALIKKQNQQLTLKSNLLELEIQNLKKENQSLKDQNLQLKDSSKLFLEEIQNLQEQLSKVKEQKQKYFLDIKQNQQKFKTFQQIVQRKNKQIQDQIKSNQRIITENLYLANQIQQFQSFKKLYVDLNQNFKYLSVQKDILKKQLQENKQIQQKLNKLQSINKKLIAKNKYLQREIEELQYDNQSNVKINKNKVNCIGLNGKNHQNQRNSLNNLDQNGNQKSFLSINNQKPRSISQILNKNQNPLNNKKVYSNQIPDQQQFLSQQQIQEISNISNNDASQSQLSFQLSPQKKSPHKNLNAQRKPTFLMNRINNKNKFQSFIQ